MFTVGEVVVQGSRESTVEAAGTTTQLAGEQLRARGAADLAAALAGVPGLQLGLHTKGYTRVLVRGFEQDRVAVLMDGIPLGDVYSADLDLARVPLLNLARVAVRRGAASALYGTSGAAGVINAITRRPLRPGVQARAEYGQGGRVMLDLAAGAAPGRAYYWLTASLNREEGYRPSGRLDARARRTWFDRLVPYGLYGRAFDEVVLPAKDSYLGDTGRWDHTDHQQWELAGKAGCDLGAGWEGGVVARFQRREARTNTYEANAYSDYKAQDGLWQDPVLALSTPLQIKKAALRNRAFVWPAAPTYQLAPYLQLARPGIGFKGLLYHTRRQADEEGYASTDHRYPKDQAAVLAGFDLDPYLDRKTYGAAGANLFLSLGQEERGRLSLALLCRDDWFDARQQAISPAASPHIAATSYGLRAYRVSYLESFSLTLAAEEERALGERLRLSAGISYDAQWLLAFKERTLFTYTDAYRAGSRAVVAGTRDGLNLVVGAVYAGGAGWWRVQGSLARKTRFPTLGEYAKVDSLHDRGLKPERIYSGSVGVDLDLRGETLHWRSDYYYTAVFDRIEKIAGGGEPPVNIERLVAQGVENSLSWRTRPWGLNTRLSYVYLRARSHDHAAEETVNKGSQRAGVPSHQLALEVRAEPGCRTRLVGWLEHTRGQVAYVMRERPVADEAGIPYDTAHFGTVPLHHPLKVNLKVEWRLGGHAALYCLGTNLLDDYEADPFNPGPGRSLSLGWTYER
ncbi:MAG: TonB-dependent receptor plug domain-containing protein [Candidatus Latescibacteria bacterium]|nr:TonB-dependent receptor plug domain-containing protein [Candidatus Latescibacterota bacterium]